MRIVIKKSLVFVMILLFLGSISQAAITSSSIYAASDAEQELDLLHGETLVYLLAFEDVDSVNLTYSIPPNYGNQAPIFIEIRNDTTADIISYKVVNDTNQPNKVIKFEIGPIDTEEAPSLHFDFWVLVKNEDYSDLPRYVKMPKKSELPEETKTWLASTKAIQSDSVLIKHKAHQLSRLSLGNLIKLADKIVRYTRIHRPIVSSIFNFILRRGHAQDALSSYLLGNVCTGAANLGTALFRANGVPAKDLIVMPTVNFWFQMHFISEYYCPSYGWVLAETSFGVTPHEPKNDIILRVNYPEDENKAGNMFSGYGGIEQWYWIDSKTVWLAMVPLFEESGARACIEKELMTDDQNANLAFNLTQDVYELHTRYLGVDLTGDNITHFDNAILAQQTAIECFNQSNFNGYLDNISIAYDEYQQII